MTNKLDIFLSLVSDKTSGWLEKAQYDKQNQDWLDFSAEIAIKVLRTLRVKSLSQKDLAALMNVSPQYINKIVKGNENLSIETIYKLQNALDIILIPVEPKTMDFINTFQSTIEYSAEFAVFSDIDLLKEAA